MSTLLVLITVFGPMVISCVVLLMGISRGWARVPWLAGWAYTFVPACYLSFQNLCSDMAGTCPSPAALDRALQSRVALVALVLALVVLAVGRLTSSLRGTVAVGVVFMVLVGFAEVWMWQRLRQEDVGFAGLVCLLLLAWGIVAEITALRAARLAAVEAHPHDHDNDHDAGADAHPA